MRILNNNKGSLLVILVICMTLIAVLGASFVSMIGSKQQGFVSLLDGHRANNVAKAGVEWAIRFASVGTDANGNSIFFSNPTLTFTKDIIYGSSTEGSFSTSYSYSTNILTSNGTYNGVTETITLSNFRRYLSPITLIPAAVASQKARYDGSRLVVPVIGNHKDPVTITQIDLTTNLTNRLLRYIDGPGGVHIFDYNDTDYSMCDFSSLKPPCNLFGLGILLRSTESFGPAGSPDGGEAKLKSSQVNPDNTYNYVFEFLSLPGSSRLHTITFNSSPVPSTIKFTP